MANRVGFKILARQAELNFYKRQAELKLEIFSMAILVFLAGCIFTVLFIEKDNLFTLLAKRKNGWLLSKFKHSKYGKKNQDSRYIALFRKRGLMLDEKLQRYTSKVSIFLEYKKPVFFVVRFMLLHFSPNEYWSTQNNLVFLIKTNQFLKHISGVFHWAQTLNVWGVLITSLR